jgi:V8-like Glu-specific endopeptidase
MRRSAQATAISLISGAILAVPLAAHADPGPISEGQAATAADQLRVERFWTPERMRQATPLDTVSRSAGSMRAVRRGLSQITPASAADPGDAWNGGGRVTHTVGRVFFIYQGSAASCSGDAVTSANKSTVITAGHCVKLDGKWHKNWVFVPGYHNGKAPYGKWTAMRTLTTPQWKAREDLNYDVGAAVVNRLGGRKLTDVVGGQGIAFNQKRGQQMYDFGYPAATPYDGTKLIYCSGTTIDDPLTSNDQGLLCDMTGGSSGGPWFLKFNETTGTGIQNSVNSFKYNFLPTHMFGPYFGDDAKNLYNRASHS